MVVDKSGERVREMFAEISGKYDRMNHLLSANVDRYWRWRTVRELRLQKPGPILDVCTGTGKQKSFRDYLDRKAILGPDGRGGAMALLVAVEMANR